jgi:hypothetical protein
MRRRRLPIHVKCTLESRKQLMQPPMVRSPGSRRQTRPFTCRGYCHRPLLAEQNVVPRFRPACKYNFALPGGPRHVLSRQARQAREGRTSRVEHRGLSALTPSWLYTRGGAIGRALRPDRLISKVQPVRPLRTGPPRYCLQFGTASVPRSADLAETFQDLLGTNKLGVTAVALLNNSLAPSTYASYDSALRQFFILCTKENIAPLQATQATMFRYTAWLALLGTVAACSLQPYFSAVNKFFRDHRRQPMDVGELLADARRGLEMLQHRLVPTASRLPLPAPVALDILKAAAALRDTLTWTTAPLHATFQSLLSCLRQLHLFLPRGNWRPLPHRRPNCRQTFTSNLPFRAKI